MLFSALCYAHKKDKISIGSLISADIEKYDVKENRY